MNIVFSINLFYIYWRIVSAMPFRGADNKTKKSFAELTMMDKKEEQG